MPDDSAEGKTGKIFGFLELDKRNRASFPQTLFENMDGSNALMFTEYKGNILILNPKEHQIGTILGVLEVQTDKRRGVVPVKVRQRLGAEYPDNRYMVIFEEKICGEPHPVISTIDVKSIIMNKVEGNND